MPRKRVLSARRRLAMARMAYLRGKYGWTFRGMYDDTGRRLRSGAGYLGRGARRLSSAAISPFIWAGRKAYENPLGTMAILGSGALGVMTQGALPAARIMSPLLSYGVPAARLALNRYSPIKSNRFTRGLDRGVSMAMTGMSFVPGASIPWYLFNGAMGALNVRNMYHDTRPLASAGNPRVRLHFRRRY